MTTFVYKSSTDTKPLPARIHLPATHVLISKSGSRIEVNVTDPRMLHALAQVYTVEAVKAS